MRRISVIIDSCDTAEFIGEAIDSVLNQTRPADEIILCDASVDHSRSIISNYAASAPTIKTTFAAPTGQLDQIISGLEQTSGDLIFLLDGDDRYQPTHLEQMEQVWRSFPKADVLYCRHRLIGEQDLIKALNASEKHEDADWLGPIDLDKQYDWGISTALAYSHPNYHIGGLTSALSFRRDHLCRLPLRELCDSHPGQFQTNADYIMLLASALSAGRKVYAPLKTVEYRLHKNSFTGRKMVGDRSSVAIQHRGCLIARSWLCCQPGFDSDISTLLASEMAAIPSLSEGHRLLYEEAISFVPRNQRQKLISAQEALAAAETRIRDLEERLSAIQRSTSWRISAPIRHLIDKGRDLFGSVDGIKSTASAIAEIYDSAIKLRRTIIPQPRHSEYEKLRVNLGGSVLHRSLSEHSLDGIGRYSLQLLKEFNRSSFIAPRVYCFSGVPRHPSLPDTLDAGSFEQQSCVSLLPRGAFSIAERAMGDRTDIIHSTDHFVPRMVNIPVVATLHDAIPLSHPEWVGYSSRRMKNFLWKRSATWASHIITVSEDSKRQISQWFGIPKNIISVTPLGVDQSWFNKLHSEEIARVLGRHALPKCFFFFVGTLQPRKNVLRLIEAHRTLPADLRRAAPLVVGGRSGWSCDAEQAILQEGDEGCVRWLRHIPEEDLPALFQAASAFVLPSLHEGFGLPVLEAFASGTPVVASIAGSIPEVAADAALLFDPIDIRGMAHAMQKVIEDKTLADTLRGRGRERARLFTWERTARLTAEVYRQVLADWKN